MVYLCSNFKVLLSWLVLLLFSVPLLCLLTLYLLHHTVVRLIAALVKPNFLGIIKGLDVSFDLGDLYERPLANVSIACVVEGEVDPGDLVNRLQFLQDPSWFRFTSTYPLTFLGCRFWAKCSYPYRVSDHISVNSEPILGNQLNQTHSEFLQRPFQEGKPLWNILCVPMYMAEKVHNDPSTSQVKTVLIIRAHHVIADGLTMVKFVSYLSDNPPKPNGKQVNSASSYYTTMQKMYRLMCLPLVQLRLLWDLGVHKDLLVGRKKTTRASLVTVQFPLSEFKGICRSFKSEVSAPSAPALNLIVSGVLRRILLVNGHQHHLQGATNTTMSLPLIPGRHNDLSQVKVGNCWTNSLFKLPVDTASICRRRKIVSEDFKRVDSIKLQLGYPYLAHVHSLLPTFVYRLCVQIPLGAPVEISNIPGPSMPLHLFGKLVSHQYFVLHNVFRHTALTTSFYSYNGVMNVALLINDDVLEKADVNVAKIPDYFHQETQSILNQVNDDICRENL